MRERSLWESIGCVLSIGVLGIIGVGLWVFGVTAQWVWMQLT